MKKLAFALLLSILFSFAAFAAEKQPNYKENTINTEQCIKDATNQLVKRGCCSWHGGVCGCSNGRAMCCDGTLSPSCGCEKEEIEIPN